MEADEAARLPELAALGVDGCVFWGSDYPHFDCTYPGAVAELESHLAPLDAALADKIRHGNAARFMGLS